MAEIIESGAYVTAAPLLMGHDHAAPAIGRVIAGDGYLEAVFDREAKINMDMFFNVFGDCGFKVLEMESGPEPGEVIILRARILEWSHSRPDQNRPSVLAAGGATVWALMGWIDYEGGELLGVYSSEEKASQAETEFREAHPGLHDNYSVEQKIINRPAARSQN